STAPKVKGPLPTLDTCTFRALACLPQSTSPKRSSTGAIATPPMIPWACKATSGSPPQSTPAIVAFKGVDEGPARVGLYETARPVALAPGSMAIGLGAVDHLTEKAGSPGVAKATARVLLPTFKMRTGTSAE